MVKYTEDGRKVHVHESINERVFRISYVYYRDEDDEGGEEGEWVSQDSYLHDKPLFDSPPLPRFHAEVSRIEQQIERIEGERKALAAEVQALRSDKSALDKEFRQVPGLKNIVEFLRNPPTHFIMQRYHHPRIVPAEECKVEHSVLAHMGIKTDWGISGPQVVWWVKAKPKNSWDSTDSERAIPCNGIEDAKEKFRSALAAWYRDNPNRGFSIADIKMLRENGIEVPASYIAAMVASMTAEKDKIGADVEDRKQKKQGEIEQWQALLDPAAQASE